MQIKICLGIQLRVFGVKSFFTLKMSRSLKMLLPVSHGFIKDWSMEIYTTNAIESLNSTYRKLNQMCIRDRSGVAALMTVSFLCLLVTE